MAGIIVKHGAVPQMCFHPLAKPILAVLFAATVVPGGMKAAIARAAAAVDRWI